MFRRVTAANLMRTPMGGSFAAATPHTMNVWSRFASSGTPASVVAPTWTAASSSSSSPLQMKTKEMTPLGRRVSTTGIGGAAKSNDGVANAQTDVSNAQAAVSSALSEKYFAIEAINSARLGVFDALVGVAMHTCGSNIQYRHFVGFRLVDNPEVYVKGLLEAYKEQSLGQAKEELRQAETKLGQAETKLGQAETKLGQAKEELRQAKEELRQAKEELRQAEMRAQMWTTTEEIVSIVEDKANHKSFFTLTESGPNPRPGLIAEVNDYISYRIKKNGFIPTESQHSVALVLAGSNGVGKTYSSFFIGSGVANMLSSGPGVRPRIVVSAYCGVNNGWSLDNSERSQINSHGRQGLESVLYVRLALALQHRAANMNKPWECLQYCVEKSMSKKAAFMVIRDAVVKMQQFYPSCEVVVFGVVDEVQIICEEKSELDGPRLILRFLREIQVALRDTGVLFVGLTTGTLYAAHQSDPTLGTNLFLTKPFCDSFDNLKLDYAGAESLNENEVRIAKLVAYPRVRLLQYPMEEWAATVGRGMFVRDEGRAIAQKLLPHALLKTAVYMGDYGGAPTWLGHHLPAKPASPQATGTSLATDDDKRDANSAPEERCGDMYVPLDDYLLMMECVRSLTSFSPTITTSHLLNPIWSNFETCAGQVIMCIIALATSEKSGKAVRDAVISTNQWLKTMFGSENIPILTKCACKNSSDPKSNMTPFVGCDSLKTAIESGVRQEVKDWVSEMGDNTCLLINCGGDAPFDYILFVKVVVPSTKNISLRVVLIDAKHSEKGTKSVDYNGTGINNKHKQIEDGLKNGLKNWLSEHSDLKVGPPFIVTNKKERSVVEYLTRENMKLGGVTRFLFDVEKSSIAVASAS